MTINSQDKKLSDYFKTEQKLFPTFSICIKCQGVSGAYNGEYFSKEEAYPLYLIQLGTYYERFKNSNMITFKAENIKIPKICDCKCQHEMKRVRNLANCLNEIKCTKCGYRTVVDSSD